MEDNDDNSHEFNVAIQKAFRRTILSRTSHNKVDSKVLLLHHVSPPDDKQDPEDGWVEEKEGG